MATMMPSGMTQPNRRSFQKVDSIRPENSTLCASISATSGCSSTPGMRVTEKTRTSSSGPSHWRRRSPGKAGGAGRAPGLAIPRISRSVRATRSILSARSSSRNLEYGSSTLRGASSQDCSSDSSSTTTRA